MISRRKIIRKIAAFITALNYLISVNFVSLSYAADMFEEGDVTVTDTEMTEARKTEYVRLVVNGSSVPECEQIIDALFFNVTSEKQQDGVTEVSFPEDMELKDNLWENRLFERGGDVFADLSDHCYRLDSIEKKEDVNEIYLTEYYDLADISGDEFTVYPAEEKPAYNGKYPYGTIMKISASEGWIADDITFELHGKPDAVLVDSENNQYNLEVNNGSDFLTYPFRKSSYYIYCPYSDNIRCVINGKETNNLKCSWLDDSVINAEFFVRDDADIKISKVFIVNNQTGDRIDASQKTDGKNAVIKGFNTEMLDEAYNDGMIYSFEFETVSDFVELDTFYNNDFQEKRIYDTILEENQFYIKVPPIIYENGIAKYIIDSYIVDKSVNIIEPTSLISEDNLLNNSIKVPYDKDNEIKVHYKLIKSDFKSSFNVVESINKISNSTEIYSVKKNRIIDFIFFDEVRSYITIYETINNDCSVGNLSNPKYFRYVSTSEKDLSFSALNIKSILYLENGEFHNILSSPLCFYMDDYAPKLSLSNTDSGNYNSDLWSDGDYKFEINADDHEAFPQAEGAADEINEVYRMIDNASSGISKINIGDYIFEKKDGVWEGTLSEGAEPEYEVSVTEISEDHFAASVSLKKETGLKGLEKELKVSVTDRCDNKSEEVSAAVKIDTLPPSVSSITVKNSYIDNENRFTAVNKNNFAAEITVSDKFSGIDTVTLEYGDTVKHYRTDGNSDVSCESDGESLKLRFPVETMVNRKERLKVTVADRAGNQKTYYYRGDRVTENERDGYFIIVDTEKPECRINVPEADYTDANGEMWFRRLPKLDIHVSDIISEVYSGIESISVSVNGKLSRLDLMNINETDDYSITLMHDPDDSDRFDAYLTDGDNMWHIGTFSLSETDGKVTAEVYADDNAGNRSDTYSVVFYTDTDSPSSSEKYGIENETDELRTFGSFFNRDIELTAEVSEPENRPSAGLKKAYLYFAGEVYEYEFSSSDEKQARFSIPFDSSVMHSMSGNPYIEVIDNVGNSSGKMKLVSSEGSSLILFEDQSPEIIMHDTAFAADYKDAEGNKWFRDTVKLRYRVDDSSEKEQYSGLKETRITVNEKTAVKADYRSESAMTESAEYDVSTDGTLKTDGRFDIEVTAEDNAGNPASASDTVWIDNTAPEITEVSFAGIGSVPVSIAQGVIPLAYGYFISPGTELKVKAEDRSSSSGLAYIAVDLYNFDGTLNRSFRIDRSELEYSDGVYTGKIKLPELFKGVISTYAADNVENKSEEKKPSGFIIENASEHAKERTPEIVLPETSYTDQNGLPLYNGEISAVLSAFDSFSGIRSVEWNLSEYGENVWKRITADSSGKISGDSAESFQITGTDLNLVTSLRGNISASANRGNSVLRMRMTDNSGHVSYTEKYFSIDKSAPEITVRFDDAVHDSENSSIFRTARTAFIRVKERSFDGSLINISAEGGAVSGWTLVEGTAGTDSAVYEAKAVFSEDGQYRLTVGGTDICGNKAAGYSTDQFIIDRSVPKLEVTSGGAEKVNDRFYSGSRTLTLRITEKNFDASRISVTGTADGSAEDFPVIKEWSSSGDVHTAVLSFEKNAEYTVNISGTDKAGNRLETYSESFCIDSAGPEIRFEGVKDKSANSGAVSLSAFITDKNLVKDTVSVKVTGAVRGDITDTAGSIEETEDGLVFRLSEIPEKKEFDDIYSVKVNAEDMAGNKVQKEMMFSVNRFGSNYVFEESTLRIANTYLKKPQDVVLHEINTDRLKVGKTAVSIVKDSVMTELSEGVHYTAELSGGDGSWYDYKYIINADNFNDDAAYMVVISSEDEAGNQNNSSSNEKKAELRFGVDKTPPKCVPLNIQNNGSYRTDALEVQFSVSDNILLDDVTVYLNDVDITEDMVMDGSTCIFTVYSSDSPQNVTVTARDKAGNETEEKVENILVTENLYKILTHKTWVKAAAGTVVGGGLAGGVTAIIRKRKKN